LHSEKSFGPPGNIPAPHSSFIYGGKVRAYFSAQTINEVAVKDSMRYHETGGGRSNGQRVLILFLLPLIVFASARAGLAAGFGAATNYAAGAGPLSVTAGDFNRDGKLDLAAANSDANSASVLLGNGDGTFKAAVNYSVGLKPYAIAAGDFNGDGKPDLATANNDAGNVSVLLGTGTGTFLAAVNYGVGLLPRGLAVGDFNGDGKQDLVTANFGADSVSLLAGRGDGTFETAMPFGAGAGPRAVAVGDFNGDGRADLIVANANGNNVSFLRGIGDGSFAAAVNFAAGQLPRSLAVADFNGDSRPDVAVANGNSNNVTVLKGYGNGTFTTAVNYATGAGPSGIAAADFNRDGRFDLAVSDFNAGTLSVLYGNGNATFQTKVDQTAGSQPAAVAGEDFNGDGSPDLASADMAGNNLNVLLATSSPFTRTFGAAAHYDAGLRPSTVAAADFNRDGRLDLVTASHDTHAASVLLGVGDGTFKPAVGYAVGNITLVITGDFNGDGRADLLAGTGADGNLYLLAGVGDGTFKSAATAAYVNGIPSAVAASDFNGDGKLDLASASELTDKLTVIFGNGDRTFKNESPQYFNLGTDPSALAVADFNRDGKLDLVAANSGSGNVSVLLGGASGAFKAPVVFAAGPNASSVVVGDFNRDGKPDVATANADGNNVSLLLGNGTGGFSAHADFDVNASPRSLTVADFNRDGRLDLATTNYSADQLGNNVSVLYGKGTGAFETALNFGLTTVPYTQPVAIAAADLNRDGKADLAVANYGTGNDGSGQGLYALMNVQAGFTIGGRVTDGAGHGVSGVTVALTGAQTGTATTDVDGNYSFLIRAAGTYTLTPSKTNYSFNPSSRTFTDAAASQTANFTATLNRLVISGKVKDNLGGFLRFVTVKLTGSAASETSTDTDGNYSFDITPGGSYTVTPVATGYAFTPASRAYASVTQSHIDADFTGSPTYNIGGQVLVGTSPLSGVTVALTGTRAATATTDLNGNYKFANLPSGGNYTVTPSKTNYTFTPASRTYSALGANQAAANFAATLKTYTIGGKVLEGGNPLAGVTVTLSSPSPAGFSPRTATTSSSGTYSFPNLPAGRTYNVKPAKLSYVFTPVSRTYTSLSASQTLADFAATFKTYSVTGRVTAAGTTNGISGVTMTVTSASPSGFAPRTVLTNSTGYYTFSNLPAGRNYIIKPTKTGLNFTPTSRSITNLSTNLAAGSSTNFTGAP
jgi:hypothetical protein